jgi:pyruvate,water dikinase
MTGRSVVRTWLDGWRRRLAGVESEAEEAARRQAFRARYHHFKLLLDANHKALETIARLEQARSSGHIDMQFLRARATQASVSVATMLRELEAIVPQVTGELWQRFARVTQELESALSPVRASVRGPYVLRLDEVEQLRASEVGGKMAGLGEVRNRLGFTVPEGFVITTAAYERLVEHNDLRDEINSLLQAHGESRYDLGLSTAIQQRITAAEVPPEVAAAVREAYAELECQSHAGVHVSLRSSARDEDILGASFAGQYRSALNVSPENLLDTYKEVVASKYSLHAMLYRLEHGIRDEDVEMAVGCNVMVEARSGGVAYSQGPTRDDDAVLVASVWGLPQAVVDGSVPCDVFRLSRAAPPRILSRRVALQQERLSAHVGEGVRKEPLAAELHGQASLRDDEAIAVARLALLAELHYESPQDLEWAIDAEGRIYILQCRPLERVASLGPRPASDVAPLAQGGVTASPGVGAGPVFVAERNADLLSFPAGAVLVSAQSSPLWGALVRHAAAVVTEQGSATSHLASVAREFGVPALFGLAGARAQLRLGDVVTVDATLRAVYPGRLESLLTAPARARAVRSGIDRVLDHVLALSSPLHLRDPEGPGFRPEKCSSLHDFTRFAHEVSVREMFSFARGQPVSGTASKQLVVGVPQQLWVLDLGGGLNTNVRGRYVGLANIASAPMLALWKGMSALPWDGPPPVDARGFVSVMFEATANPALDPAVKSHFLDKNYCIIARDFCAMQSRYGFHFASVEALVPERAADSFIVFRFRGGAADLARRLERVSLVAGLLRERGFVVTTLADGLQARLEGLESARLLEELRVLGFLCMHTRQLDMVMGNPEAVLRARARLREGLDLLLAKTPVARPASRE